MFLPTIFALLSLGRGADIVKNQTCSSVKVSCLGKGEKEKSLPRDMPGAENCRKGEFPLALENSYGL